MKKLIWVIIFLVVLSVVGAGEGDEEVIVILKDKPQFKVLGDNLENRKFMVKEVQDNVLNKRKLKVKRKFNLVNGFSATVNAEELEELRNDPNVLKVYLNKEYKINLDVSVPLIGGNSTYDLGFTGEGETVCVVDTGVNYTHENLAHSYIGGFDYCGNTGPCGTDPDDSDPMDNNGHGTHVAGIIASNHSTYKGVAPDVNIVAMKVMNGSGNGFSGDIIAGIDNCVNNKSIYNTSVISLSIGSGVYSDYCDGSSSLTEAINLAVTNGINVVVASGNNGDKTGISDPACVTNATSVGSTDKSDNIASYSNSDNILDLLAPGGVSGNQIISLAYLGGTTGMYGTSMAAPHVSGAIAVMREFVKTQNGSNLSVETAVDVLRRTGVSINDTNGITKPRIDVYSALKDLDDINPSVTLFYPENVSYLKNNISLNYSVSDMFLDSVWYDLNGNVSLNGNTTLNLSEGSYKLILYANDSANNLGQDSVSFVINLSAPIVTVSPINHFNDTDGNLIFNCSAESNFELVNINLYINSSLNQSYSASGSLDSNEFSINSVLDNSSLTWYCEAYDNNSNFDVSSERTINVVINDAPEFSGNISILSWDEDTTKDLDLSSYFSDYENNIESYNSTDVSNISLSFNDSVATLTPDANFTGIGSVIFYAWDGEFSTESNNVSLQINNTADCWNSVIETGEDCEIGDLNGESCSSQGYDDGNLSCSSCSFDTSECFDESSGSPGGESSGGGGTQIANNVIEEEVEEEIEETVEVSSEEPEVEEEVPEVKKVEKIGFFKGLWNGLKKPFVWIGGLIKSLFSSIF